MDALEIAAIVLWAFGVSLVGGLVGLVLGNLRLPLMLVFASSPAAGAGANVAVSGAAAVASATRHARSGRFDRRLFLWMAPPSLAGAVAGGLISGRIPDEPLLIAIGLVVLYGAYEVRRKPGAGDAPERPGRPHMVNAALAGFGIGVLGGFVGLILGSMRLPAMVRYVGMSPYAAIGTNAAIGVAVGLGGLVGHLPSGIDLDLLTAGCAGAIPGAWMGAQLTGRLAERTLLDACAVVLVISGLGILVQAFAG